METLWDDFLGYLEKYIEGNEEPIEQYESEGIYFILWKKGISFIQEGISPDAMDVFLEYEMQKLIISNDLSERELLELIVMKKLLFKLYAGDRLGIAELSQNFLSNELRVKYRVLLEKLYGCNHLLASEETSSQLTLKICSSKKDKVREGIE